MDEIKYRRVIEAVTEMPWAILPAKLAMIQGLLSLRAQGYRLTPDEIRAQLAEIEPHQEIEAATSGSGYRLHRNVAIIPLLGTIVPRMGTLAEFSGATSVQRTALAFRAALNDPDVGSIVFDVDSPGGQVGGVEELAQEIFGARGNKPVTAVANTLAASAAYWLASAADELVITPSGEVGSIGVFAMHEDVSEALEREGVKVQLIAAGKYKVEGNPFQPLTEEARTAIQERVEEYYDAFVTAVARGRGVKKGDVRDGFGQGRVVGAKTAVSLGMADRVGTLEQTVSRMAGRSRRRLSAAADMDYRQRRLRLAESIAPVGVRHNGGAEATPKS
jgi:capsid assembly protease